MLPVFIILGVILLIVIIIAVMYNSLVQARLRVDNAWAQIDTQLKRRFDLIPNLIETVKGYAAHESETLEKVVEARNTYTKATDAKTKAEADNMLTSSLKSIFALAEGYPELKANENFLAMQEELASTENKIAYSRQFYNDAVQMYNTQVLSFPKNIIAGMFGFTQRNFFEILNEAEKENVKVKF